MFTHLLRHTGRTRTATQGAHKPPHRERTKRRTDHAHIILSKTTCKIFGSNPNQIIKSINNHRELHTHALLLRPNGTGRNWPWTSKESFSTNTHAARDWRTRPRRNKSKCKLAHARNATQTARQHEARHTGRAQTATQGEHKPPHRERTNRHTGPNQVRTQKRTRLMKQPRVAMSVEPMEQASRRVP